MPVCRMGKRSPLSTQVVVRPERSTLTHQVRMTISIQHFSIASGSRSRSTRPASRRGRLSGAASRIFGLRSIRWKGSQVSVGACGSSTSTKPNKDFWGAGGNAASGNHAAIFLAAMVDRCFKYRLPLALLLAVLNCVPALARNVQCPAVWPGDSSKSKVKGAVDL
jgi:hypothetical protein